MDILARVAPSRAPPRRRGRGYGRTRRSRVRAPTSRRCRRADAPRAKSASSGARTGGGVRSRGTPTRALGRRGRDARAPMSSRVARCARVRGGVGRSDGGRRSKNRPPRRRGKERVRKVGPAVQGSLFSPVTSVLRSDSGFVRPSKSEIVPSGCFFPSVTRSRFYFAEGKVTPYPG